MATGPYSIGSDHWPGLSKLIEEAGETLQVVGKLIAINGEPDHWDGSNLHERMVEEVADLAAACQFVAEFNGFGKEFYERKTLKYQRYVKWHAEHATPPAKEPADE